MFQSLGKYEKTREYLEKAPVIQIKIGDRNGEATSYWSLGIMIKSLGNYDKAREYMEETFAIQIEIGDRN